MWGVMINPYPRMSNYNPDSKVYEADMGPIWGRQDPGGPHVGPMNLAIWECTVLRDCIHLSLP